MLNLLINVGRWAVVAAAWLTVIICGAAGWHFGVLQDGWSGLYSDTGVTPNRLTFGLLGLAAGVVIAGAAFGLAAAIFDIRDTIRRMAIATGAVQNMPPEGYDRPQSPRRSEPVLATRKPT